MIPQSVESQASGQARIIEERLGGDHATSANNQKEQVASGLSLTANFGWVIIAAAAFHLAYSASAASFLIILYLFALVQLSRNVSGRKAFYSGVTVGLFIAVERLDFLWKVFGGGCAALWLVYAFWIGLFPALARVCWRRFGNTLGSLLISFLWCGLEYFRSELYYLRFSWLSPGYAFALGLDFVPLNLMGTYGAGFLLAGIASIGTALCRKSEIRALITLCAGIGLVGLMGLASSHHNSTAPMTKVHVAGVQMEFPSEQEVLVRLNDLIRKYPKAELVVLSEYTFNDRVPEKVRNWCREHQRYLIVGGKDPAPGGNYYDTGFVVSPTGKIIFRQGKKVPIQFFKDGLPAVEQKLWNSPWGKIGICICYDLSYCRVTDRLVEMGAQALVVPTMDIVDWGKRQHELHARIAPIRAAEYGIPIFRVASSGISQLVDSCGHTLATAPFPGDGAMLSGVLEIRSMGHLPLDRGFALVATCLSCLIATLSLLRRNRRPNTP